MISNFNPNQKYLFGRSYSLAIGAPGKVAALQYANFPKIGADGKIMQASPIRIHFEFEKNNLGTPNKAKFELYNISPQARNAIGKGALVQFQIGYKGLIETLFVGNISEKGLKAERKGSDINLVFEAGDGESAIVEARLDKSYPPGTKLAQILTDLATAMSVSTDANPIPLTAGISLGIPDIVYGKGMVVHGACKHSLNTILTPLGLKWSVQNCSLTIIPKNKYNGAEAIVISKETGMIGVPSRNEFMSFTSLINPKLVPDALVQLISDNTTLNGFYKINKAKYEGDTHESKWDVKCECIAMPNVHQTLIPSAGFDFSKGVV